MLDQEDYTELDDEWLTADEQLTRFSKASLRTSQLCVPYLTYLITLLVHCNTILQQCTSMGYTPPPPGYI